VGSNAEGVGARREAEVGKRRTCAACSRMGNVWEEPGGGRHVRTRTIYISREFAKFFPIQLVPRICHLGRSGVVFDSQVVRSWGSSFILR
jgi:hypothetical protein